MKPVPVFWLLTFFTKGNDKINVLLFCRKPAVCGIGVEYEGVGKEWKINVLLFCRKPAVCGIGVEYEEAGREGHC
jgi:hypothetical protein